MGMLLREERQLYNKRYYATNQIKITQSNVNAFSVYCTVNHLLLAEFFFYANNYGIGLKLCLYYFV